MLADFMDFDHVLVMDQENYDTLRYICPKSQAHKLQFFLDYAPQWGTRNVPDPYYGGQKGFEQVLDMIEAAAQGFLFSIRSEGLNQHLPTPRLL